MQKNVYYNYIRNFAVSFNCIFLNLFSRRFCFDRYYYIYVILKEATSENLVIYQGQTLFEI